EESLMRMAAHPGAVPGWWLARAFSFTSAFRPAVEAAAAAAEVDRCFRRWAEGARVLREDLWRLAGEIWNCPPERVEEEGARPGRPGARGSAQGAGGGSRAPESAAPPQGAGRGASTRRARLSPNPVKETPMLGLFIDFPDSVQTPAPPGPPGNLGQLEFLV